MNETIDIDDFQDVLYMDGCATYHFPFLWFDKVLQLSDVEWTRTAPYKKNVPMSENSSFDLLCNGRFLDSTIEDHLIDHTIIYIHMFLHHVQSENGKWYFSISLCEDWLPRYEESTIERLETYYSTDGYDTRDDSCNASEHVWTLLGRIQRRYERSQARSVSKADIEAAKKEVELARWHNERN